MSHRILFRLLTVSGFLALTPLFAAGTAKPIAPSRGLSDDEVRGLLERNEVARWERAVASRLAATRELEVAKRKAASDAPSSGSMKGFDSETPEQRKAKAEKLVKDTTDKLAGIDRTLDAMREVAFGRVKAASYTVACPIRPLPDAVKISAGELREASVAAGYKALSLAGVFVPVNGAPAADAGLNDALRTALAGEEKGPAVEGAPVFSGASLKVATALKTGVVVAEVLPLASRGGALWSVRLVDASTFRVVAASSAFIPSPAAVEAAKKDYSNRDKQPVSYEISVQDRSNFVARLGAVTNFSFGIDGSGVDAALLRAALAGRPVPALNDYAYLAGVLGGTGSDAVSKALWVVQPGVEAGSFSLGSRLVGGRAGIVAPVGKVEFLPVLAKPGRL